MAMYPPPDNDDFIVPINLKQYEQQIASCLFGILCKQHIGVSSNIIVSLFIFFNTLTPSQCKFDSHIVILLSKKCDIL